MSPQLPQPSPFQLASLGPSFMGISAQPMLPPVGGYTRDDLERLRYQLLRSGEDPAMMSRVAEVIAMRPADEPRVGYDSGARGTAAQGMGDYRERQLQEQVARITGGAPPSSMQRVSGAAQEAAARRQALLDALTIRP